MRVTLPPEQTEPAGWEPGTLVRSEYDQERDAIVLYRCRVHVFGRGEVA